MENRRTYKYAGGKMKDIEEIKRTQGIVIKKEGLNGFGGTVFPIEYKKENQK